MRRRKLLVALAGLAVIAVGAVVLWPRADRITRENFDRIKKGMGRAEVEAILGPPGDYTTGPTQTTFLESASKHPVSWTRGSVFTPVIEFWETDDAAIEVGYGPSGELLFTIRRGQKRLQQSPLDNLIWRVNRQCHRWFPE
jgi:hypothetical protein